VGPVRVLVMARVWQRGWAAAFLAVLLLPPLLLRGADHADHAASSRPCAVCTAVQHTPLVRTPAPAAAAPRVASVTLASVEPAAPPAADRPVQVGRAPPLPAPPKLA